MNSHPVLGAQIISPVNKLAPELPIIRHHHEWYNGSGYPDRLIGEEIPRLARVLHVADAFEAMTAKRPVPDDTADRRASLGRAAEVRRHPVRSRGRRRLRPDEVGRGHPRPWPRRAGLRRTCPAATVAAPHRRARVRRDGVGDKSRRLALGGAPRRDRARPDRRAGRRGQAPQPRRRPPPVDGGDLLRRHPPLRDRGRPRPGHATRRDASCPAAGRVVRAAPARNLGQPAATRPGDRLRRHPLECRRDRGQRRVHAHLGAEPGRCGLEPGGCDQFAPHPAPAADRRRVPPASRPALRRGPDPDPGRPECRLTGRRGHLARPELLPVRDRLALAPGGRR